jgi:hypothetical protein
VQAVTGTAWRKSSRSNGGQQGSCVEVARSLPGHVAVRDSKDPDGPRLILSPARWRVFMAYIKASANDLT